MGGCWLVSRAAEAVGSSIGSGGREGGRRWRRTVNFTGGKMSRAQCKNGLLPSSLRIISSCLKTVTANAGNVASTVRLAGSSVSSSISARPDGQKDQVLWAGFDKLELSPVSFKHVLLLGYGNGFQVLDVEDASNVCELVSMRDGPVTFLQMQPIPVKSELEGFRSSHPLLLIVAGDKFTCSSMDQGVHLCALMRDGSSKHHQENCKITPTIVRFYSFKFHGFAIISDLDLLYT